MFKLRMGFMMCCNIQYCSTFDYMLHSLPWFKVRVWVSCRIANFNASQVSKAI
jgi:hypothetical protein